VVGSRWLVSGSIVRFVTNREELTVCEQQCIGGDNYESNERRGVYILKCSEKMLRLPRIVLMLSIVVDDGMSNIENVSTMRRSNSFLSQVIET